MAIRMTMTKPCPKCPFRSDIPVYLTAERIDELEGTLVQSYFVCHETVDYSTVEDSEDEPAETKKTQHCAGALILLEKLEQPSNLMRIYERLHGYDYTKLEMDSPVYDTFKEMRDAQRSNI